MTCGSLIIVMGPSGCGKSSVAAALAKALDAPFLEGDDFHTRANLEKMSAGNPLDDQNRTHWLDAIEDRITGDQAAHIVLACSALTQYVQGRLRAIAGREARFVLLNTTRELLASRIEGRKGHFMPTSLLDSQLEALCTPDDAIVIHACESLEIVAARALKALE